MSTDTRSDGRTGQMAETAKQGAQAVTDAGRETTQTVAEQTAAVADTTKQQLHHLVDQARSEFATQADAQGQQVVRGLHTLTDELGALASGRPEEAGRVGDLVSDAQQRMQRYVSSLDQRGAQGMLDDVSRFARQRPAAFLIGAGLAGFAIGRLMRSSTGSQGNGSQTATYRGGDWTQEPPGDGSVPTSAAPQQALAGQHSSGGQQSWGEGSWQTPS